MKTTSVAVSILALLTTLPVSVAQTGIALVNHSPEIDGAASGSIHQMLGENTTLSGSASVLNLLVPGNPSIQLNGNAVLDGTITGAGVETPVTYQITLKGNARVKNIFVRTDPKPLPEIVNAATAAGHRSEIITSANYAPVDFGDLRNLTVRANAGRIPVPPGNYGVFTIQGNNGLILGTPGNNQIASYSFEQLVLNGGATIEVVSPVLVILGQPLAADGTS